ncbi:hypothetical protein R9X47_20270 [Wukongibacter baidiensis]|uniref:leucine-rich repeat domain-containing protein n=1 Tax=Wukongibacter baidiensis TaxID=1723361 RepID=UPI003D7FC602
MDEEIKQDYKKNILMYLSALLVILILYPFNFLNYFSFAMLIYFGVYGLQNLLLKRTYKKELLLLWGIIILNLILDRSQIIYLRLDIQIAVYFAILAIYYVFKDGSKYKWVKILSIVLIIPLALSINTYMRKDALIKDRGLEQCVKEKLKESWNTKSITQSNLEKIGYLSIGSLDHVYSLEGLDNLINLEKLRLRNAKRIRDFNVLVSLPNLRKLALDEAILDNLLKAGKLNHLEELNLDDCKVNNRLTKEQFPKLRRLETWGLDLNDLSLIKELDTLEELDLDFCKIGSLNGIEKLKNLKRLVIYKAEIEDISKIKELESLEEIRIMKSKVQNMEMIKELPNIKKLEIR